jgi:hypothetical protein
MKGLYDEWDTPPNYDSSTHDWAFIKGVAVAFICAVVLLTVYLITQ